MGQTPGTVPEQPTLDDYRRDLDEGRRRRDDGTRAATLNTWAPWKRRAEQALDELAASGRPFTSDDLVERAGMPITSSRNAVGALFRAAAAGGHITAIGYQPSERPAAHGRVIRVWIGGETA